MKRLSAAARLLSLSAAPATAVTHIAIQDAVDGGNVEWMEKVSDEQYGQ